MRKSCFLFGHADTPQSVLPILEQAIEKEVANGISTFYVGYHGNFDRMAASALRSVKHRHAEILLMLVLAYHPTEQPIEKCLSNGSALGANLVQNDFKHHKRFTTISNEIRFFLSRYPTISTISNEIRQDKR